MRCPMFSTPPNAAPFNPGRAGAILPGDDN
jgi:hypothetical protein